MVIHSFSYSRLMLRRDPLPAVLRGKTLRRLLPAVFHGSEAPVAKESVSGRREGRRRQVPPVPCLPFAADPLPFCSRTRSPALRADRPGKSGGENGPAGPAAESDPERYGFYPTIPTMSLNRSIPSRSISAGSASTISFDA